MSIDKSLRMRSALVRARSVLTRAERIAELTRLGKFDAESNSPFGLPKVRVVKARKRPKKKKEEEEGADADAPEATGDAAAAPSS